jgi:hypothetical protein
MQETSRALFNAVDGNLLTAAQAAPTAALLAAAEYALSMLPVYGANDGSVHANNTNVQAGIFLAGTVDKFSTQTLFSSVYADTANMQRNLYLNKFKEIYSATLQYYLTLATAGNKPHAWYLIAPPQSGYTLCRVYFLNGRQVPYLRRKESDVGEPLGISFEGYHDYGVSFPEWRAGICSDGDA